MCNPFRLARLLPLLRPAKLLVLAGLTVWFFLWPGVQTAADLRAESLAPPGPSPWAWRLHQALTPRVADWARERVERAQGAEVWQYDVASTEWPPFTAVFYLLATDELEAAWQRDESAAPAEPLAYARPAVDAARDLLVDPSHHSWVRAHWGEDYLHRENVFFRALLIAGLTSHVRLTGDERSRPMLRDQVETLAAALDRSERGLLHDYPGECYPIDVLAAIGWIRRADPVLGTDHSAFVARAARAFAGPLLDDLGLVPYRTELVGYRQLQPSRGIGNSWVLLFAPDLWPERAAQWYSRYEQSFWQSRWWAEGFREFAPGSAEPEWQFEIDAGPVLGGFGTAANAFGIAAARRNGRWDQAATLSAQLLAVRWPLPDGTSLSPRLLSHAVAAPYLGESAILYFHTVRPAPGVPVVTGGHTSGLVALALAIYFGMSALLLVLIGRALWRSRKNVVSVNPWPRLQLTAWATATVVGAVLLWHGSLGWAAVLLLIAQLLPRRSSTGAAAAEHPQEAPGAPGQEMVSA